MVTRTGGEPSIAQGSQLAAARLHRDRDAELLEDPSGEIDEPPAHYTMERRDGSFVDDLGKCHPMRFVQPRGLAGCLLIDEAVRTVSVELHHPVAADLRSLGVTPS